MIWMTLVSFRRNLRKYSLAILSLALAVLVSCLGLSGLDLLQRATLRPLTFVAGGQVMLIDQRTNLRPAGSRFYPDPLEIKPFPAAWAQDVLSGLPKADEALLTLVAPFMRYSSNKTSSYYLAGRNQLPTSLSGLRLIKGQHLQVDDVESMIVPGFETANSGGTFLYGFYGMEPEKAYPLSIPRVRQTGELLDWDVAAGTQWQYTVDGIYDQGDALYPLLWTDLPSLQEQVGGDEPVSWVGVACAPGQEAAVKASIEAEIQKRELPLSVFSLRDLGAMLIGDFDRFEQMASYYAPVMLFVAVQIVLVNSVALILTRRKELALLRTIGLNRIQIQLMLVAECFCTALAGGLLGTLLASMLSLGISQNPTVSLIPLWLTLLTTTIVGSVATLIMARGKLSQALRNPLG